MAYFKLSLLSLNQQDTTGLTYLQSTISEFRSQLQLKPGESNFCFTYNEEFSIHKNAQKELSFSLDRMLLKGDEWIENPFARTIQIGSQLCLEDQYGNHHFFTVKNIKYTFSQSNMTYNISCQDTFSYQTIRQNEGYEIYNDPSSEDFIGAKTIDWWVSKKIAPDCFLAYEYVPLDQGLYQIKEDNKYNYIIDNKLPDKLSIKTIKNPLSTNTPYFEKIPFSGSGNAASLLIQLGENNGLMLNVYEFVEDVTGIIRRYFWFEPEKHEEVSGVTYSPLKNVQSFDLTHSGDSLTTVMNVSGPTFNDELVTLLPNISPFFLQLFNTPEWDRSVYHPGLFSEFAYHYSLYYASDNIFQGNTFFVEHGSPTEDVDINFNQIHTEQFMGTNGFATCYYEGSDLYLPVCDSQPYRRTRGDHPSTSKFYLSSLYDKIAFTYNNINSYIIIKLSGGEELMISSQDYIWELGTIEETIEEGSSSTIPFKPITDSSNNWQGSELKNAYIRISGVESNVVNEEPDRNGIIIQENISIHFIRTPQDQDLNFATMADKIPWLENKLIDFTYFSDRNLINQYDYNNLNTKIYDDLRKVNSKLLLYTQDYYAALHNKTQILSNLTNAVESIGAAFYSNIISQYAETGTVKDKTLFINSYNNLYNYSGFNASSSFLEYYDTITDYVNKYWNAQQRFLRNIKNFRDYFNAKISFYSSNAALYEDKITIEEANSDDSKPVYFSSGQKFTKIEGGYDDEIGQRMLYYSNKGNDTKTPIRLLKYVHKNNYKDFYVMSSVFNGQPTKVANSDTPVYDESKIYYKKVLKPKSNTTTSNGSLLKIGGVECYYYNGYYMPLKPQDVSDNWYVISDDSYTVEYKPVTQDDLFFNNFINEYDDKYDSIMCKNNTPVYEKIAHLFKIWSLITDTNTITFNADYVNDNKFLGLDCQEYKNKLNLRSIYYKKTDDKTYTQLPFVYYSESNQDNSSQYYRWVKSSDTDVEAIVKGQFYSCKTSGECDCDLCQNSIGVSSNGYLDLPYNRAIDSNYTGWPLYSILELSEKCGSSSATNTDSSATNTDSSATNNYTNEDKQHQFAHTFGTLLYNVKKSTTTTTTTTSIWNNIYYPTSYYIPLQSGHVFSDDETYFLVQVPNKIADLAKYSATIPDDPRIHLCATMFSPLILNPISATLVKEIVSGTGLNWENNSSYYLQGNGKYYLLVKKEDYTFTKLDTTNESTTNKPILTTESLSDLLSNISNALSQLYEKNSTSESYTYITPIKVTNDARGFFTVQQSNQIYEKPDDDNSTFDNNAEYYQQTSTGYVRVYTLQQLSVNNDIYYPSNSSYSEMSFSKTKTSFPIQIIYDGKLVDCTVSVDQKDDTWYEYKDEDNGIQFKYTITCTPKENLSALTNGQFWYKYHAKNQINNSTTSEEESATPTTNVNSILQEHALAIETQLQQYWNVAYNASHYCEYFLPENWQPTSIDVNNHFYKDIFTINGDLIQINSLLVPQVDILSVNGEINLQNYHFRYNNYLESSDSFVEQQNNISLTEVAQSNRVISDTFINTLKQDLNQWIAEPQSNCSYYYPVQGGMKHSEVANYLSISSEEFSRYNGIYLMILDWLKNCTNRTVTNYTLNKQQHNNIWTDIYRNYPSVILESNFTNETATTSDELFILAQNAFKDLSHPERGYSITIIKDWIDIKGSNYRGQELRVGDSIQVQATDYYDQYDDVKTSLNQFLFITDIKYNLRQDTDTSLTVNSIKYQDKVIQQLVKLIR